MFSCLKLSFFLCLFSISAYAQVSHSVSENFASLEMLQPSHPAGTAVKLNFRLTRRSSKAPIVPAKMQVHHEEYLHIVIYDEVFKVFGHVHGKHLGNGLWTTQEKVALSKNGKYRISAEGLFDCRIDDILQQDECSQELEVGFRAASHFSVVQGEAPNTPIDRPNIGVSQSGSLTGYFQGDVIRVEGIPWNIEVEKWLGAYVHLWYVSKETELVAQHTHGDTKPTRHGTVALPFHAPHRLKPGNYRVWAQFKVQGQIHTFFYDIGVRHPGDHD